VQVRGYTVGLTGIQAYGDGEISLLRSRNPRELAPRRVKK